MKKKIKKRFSQAKEQARQMLRELFFMRVKIEQSFPDKQERLNYIKALIKEFEE